MRTDTTFGTAVDAFIVFALVRDVTPTRATVITAGESADVWDAYHDADDERLQIVGIGGEAPAPGDRILHCGNFVSPDDFVLGYPNIGG